ncbi:unnamed protein product [Gadus morhua 'NCC']
MWTAVHLNENWGCVLCRSQRQRQTQFLGWKKLSAEGHKVFISKVNLHLPKAAAKVLHRCLFVFLLM